MTPFDQVHHMAFVYGRIGDGEDVLARLHRANVIGDVFGGAKPITRRCSGSSSEGRGVLVYPARRRGRRAGHGDPAGRRQPRRRRRARGNGARSASARRSCKDLGISSIRLLDLGASSPTSASPASASRSCRPRRSEIGRRAYG